MGTIDFILDERALAVLPTDPSGIPQDLQKWLDTAFEVQECSSPKEARLQLSVTSDYLSVSSPDGVLLFDYLYSSIHPPKAQHNVRLFQIMLDRCKKFDPVDHVESAAYEAGAGEGAAACVSKQVAGFVTLRDDEALSNIPGWDKARFVAVRRTEDIKRLARLWLIEIAPNEAVFLSLTSIAFPNLFFCDDARFSKFHDPYAQILPIVVAHLAFLGDQVQELFSKHKGQRDQIEAEAAAKHNISMSPESPNTHANRDAMKYREVAIAKGKVMCEWHTKIFYDHGRIHFHPGDTLPQEVLNLTNGKVIIGKFADHLPL